MAGRAKMVVLLVAALLVAAFGFAPPGRAGHLIAGAGANVRAASRLPPAARGMRGARTIRLADDEAGKLISGLGWAKENSALLQVVGTGVAGIVAGAAAWIGTLVTKAALNATEDKLLTAFNAALNATKAELLTAIGATSFAQAVVPVIFDKELLTSCRKATLTALDLPATGMPTHVTIGFDDPYVRELLCSSTSGRSLRFLVTMPTASLIVILLIDIREGGLREVHKWDVDPAALTLPQQTSFRGIEALDGQSGKWTVQLR